MGGFRKTGIYPLNPGVIDDKMLCQLTPNYLHLHLHQVKKSLRLQALVKSQQRVSQEQQILYEQRYREGYDVPDVEYEAWLRILHPSGSSHSSFYSYPEGTEAANRKKEESCE